MSSNLDYLQLGLEECWNIFKSEGDLQETEYKQLYHLIRHGIGIKFDINIYLNGHIIIKPKTGKVFIRGHIYSSESLYTELEKRERLIKGWLIENLTNPGIVSKGGR